MIYAFLSTLRILDMQMDVRDMSFFSDTSIDCFVDKGMDLYFPFYVLLLLEFSS